MINYENFEIAYYLAAITSSIFLISIYFLVVKKIKHGAR